MKAAIGGTFNVLHRGHRALFERAFQLADEIVVGIASDEMAKERRELVRPYAERRERLEEYLRGAGISFQLVKIDDMFGPTRSVRDLDMLVVSEDSRTNAPRINEERGKLGLPAMQVVVVPTVLAQDWDRISSSRVLSGEIDEEGSLLVPLRVNVGSTNPIKVEAVKLVIGKIFDRLEVEGISVDTGVPKQPRANEVLKGAINRAKAAIGDAHLGVGIEAGLCWNEMLQWYFDMQYCVIVDRAGKSTVGHGSGFWYPPAVIDAVRSGASVDEAMKGLTGIDAIGHKMGSVGYLSEGLIDRRALSEQAVMAAMIPRMRPDLYSHMWRRL